MRKNLIISGIIVVAVILVAYFFYPREKVAPTPLVTSFKECAEAGNPVMESYPRRCVTPNGTSFTEIIPSKVVYENTTKDTIVIDTPLPEETVGNSFVVSGKARGMWFFEASFPLEVLDSAGKMLLQIPVQATGDWMTTEFVPFTVTVTLPATSTGKLTLRLKNDNPSGLPENQKSVSFTLIKKEPAAEETSVLLYYYNPKLDQGVGGVQCSAKGLVAVKRTIPKTTTPLQEAIKLLLLGTITTQEHNSGIESEFPLEGLTLTAATLTNGNATLTFDDPKHKTVGGSCRTAILWRQIEATAKQFSTVKSVRFLPEELFQP